MRVVAGKNKQNIVLLLYVKEQNGKIIGKDLFKKEKSFLKEDFLYEFTLNSPKEEQQFEELANLYQFFYKQKELLDVEEVYEILIGQNQHFYSLSQIEDSLIEDSHPINKLALYQFFLTHPLYFRMSPDLKSLDLTPQNILELEKQKLQKAEQEKEKENLLQAEFYQLLEKAEEKTSFSKEIEKQYIYPLKNFAIYDDKSEFKQQAEKIIQLVAEKYPMIVSLKGNLSYQAFRLLVLLQVYHQHENLALKKSHWNTQFTDEELEESRLLEEKMNHTSIEDRKDLRDIFTITIDGEDTKDFDDAISFIEDKDGYKIYIHIADVASFLTKGSTLDTAAYNKHRTLYLVDKEVTLLPSNISQNSFALMVGKDSFTLSYEFTFNKSFELTDTHIYKSVICVDNNYSYKEVDEVLTHKKPNKKLVFLEQLLVLTQNLQHKRIYNNQGIDILIKIISPIYYQNKLELKVYNPAEYSAFIIRELMILVNTVTAEFLHHHHYPCLYICQEASETEEIINRIITTKHEFMDLGRIIKRSMLSVQNTGHSTLGLDFYTQVTSPIRRYNDIIVQRLLLDCLLEQTASYSQQELEEILLYQEERKKIGNTIESETNKYYLLSYIQNNLKGSIITGVAIKALSAKDYLIELDTTGITCKAKTEEGNIPIGSSVNVKIHTIYPRLGIALGTVL